MHPLTVRRVTEAVKASSSLLTSLDIAVIELEQLSHYFPALLLSVRQKYYYRRN